MKPAHAAWRGIACVFPALSIAAGLAIALAASTALGQSKSGFTYNGMDYISYSQNEYLENPQGPDSAAALRATGANYTAVMATWYVQTYTSTSIAPASYSPSDDAVIAAIQNLQAQGITVTLKPHVDSMDGIWRGDFTWPSSDTTTAEQQAWLTAWFTSYESFILHFAEIASENNVGTMVIGTEFAKLTGNTCAGSCESYWLQYVINPIHAAYPNLTLAYGANATSAGDEFTTVSFWNDIDIIGVDGYFPLTGQEDPSIQQLVNAWTVAGDNVNGFAPFLALENLHSAYPAKPFIFTEIGYESTPGANEQPYNSDLSDGVDDSEQANCYEAFFQVFSGQPWMNGVFWWDWTVSAPDVSTDTGYSPEGKYAGTTILPEWYESTTESFTLAPANSTLIMGQGLSTSTTISITPLDGFTGTVTLAASGLPSGVTASFSPGAVGDTQILTLTASSTATIGGPGTITITGTSNTLTATTTIALTVEPAIVQTITFANPGDQQVGTQLALMATASSGLPVSYMSSTTGVCTISGSTASLSNTGTCTITASQAGNGLFQAAASVPRTFQVTTYVPVQIPADAQVILTQVEWLNTFTGYVQTSNNPTGGSFAVNALGEIAEADTNNLYLINAQTGAETTLGVWSGASAVAIDGNNNIYVGSLYGAPETVVKLPYVGGTSNGGYAAFTTPTTGLAACTALSTTECAVSHVGTIYPDAMAFDAKGDLFWITGGDGNTSGYTANGIYECAAACLGGTGSPVELYQEPLASTAPEPVPTPPATTPAGSGQLIAGSLAIDSAGNLFFTDSSTYVALAPSYAYTNYYSNLNELPVSTGAGYGGKMTGYSASPEILYTLTPATIGPYDNELDAVAVLRTANDGDTVYFADQSDGVFGFPDTPTGIPLAAGQPTALYQVSPQGAKVMTLDGVGNVYLAASSTAINSSGADTVAEVKINNLAMPATVVGTPADTPIYNPATGITSGQIFAVVNDGIPNPALVFTTVDEFGKNGGEFGPQASGAGSTNSLNAGVAFPVVSVFNPADVGERSAVVTGADSASGGGSGTSTFSGVGQGPLLDVDPGIWTAYPAAPGIGFGAGNTIRADAAGDIFVGDGSALFEIPAGSPSSATPTEIASGFSSISDMVFDAGGDLYIADSTQQEVFEIPGVGGSLVPANQSTVVSRSTTFGGAPVNTPGALAIGPDGVLYIADSGTGNVDTYNPSNGATSVRIVGLADMEGIAVDGADKLYVTTSGAANSGALLIYSPGGAVASVSLGSIAPKNVAVDPSGSVFIPDQTSGDIVRIPTVSGTLTFADATTVEQLTGEAGSIALDEDGNLYANDVGNDTVYAIQRTEAELTFATPIADGSVSSPLDLSVENAGNLTLNVLTTTTPTGPFMLTAGTPACTAVIAAGADCADAFEFAPTGTESGAQTGAATIGESEGDYILPVVDVTLTGTAAIPSFTLSSSSPTLSVAQGSSSVDTIDITDVGGFTGNVTLAASGLPSGVTASFAAGFTGSQVMTLTASATATLGGPVTVTVTGTSGTLTETTTIQLTVTPPESFTLSAQSGSVTVVQGSTATDTITVTPANGFRGSVTLSASGLPSGVSASFAAGTVSGTQVMTLTATSTATTGGPMTVTITGTSGSMTETTTISLTVVVPPGFALAAAPASVTVIQGGSGTSTITVTESGGFIGAVTLAASGLPSGVTASFAAGTVAGTQVMTLAASSTAATGTATVTITGTGASGAQTLTATTSVSLTVNVPPGFSLSASPGSVTVDQGGSVTSTITVTDAGGFTGAVTLAASGLPGGVTAGFAAGTVAGTQVVTLTAGSSAALGQATVAITGTGTSGAQTLAAATTVMLTVVVPPSFSLSASPGSVTVAQGGSTTTIVTVTDVGGFNGAVSFTATGFPSGVTHSFAPGTISGTEVLTMTATSSATVEGPVTVTITGMSGNLFEETSIELTVTAPPGFTISGNGASISIQPGATTGNTASISVTGSNGFTGSVNLTCSTSPTATSDPPTCSLSPNPLSVTGNAAVIATLTVTTTAPTNAQSLRKQLFWPSAGGAALALMLFFGIPRRRRNWLALLALLALFASIGATGCGGHSSNVSGGGNAGTTPGTYTITVNGTSGNISGTVGTVTLTVQ
ncbi:MAG: hypothetical protein WBE72_19050 [Terracidiphilus sp.]